MVPRQQRGQDQVERSVLLSVTEAAVCRTGAQRHRPSWKRAYISSCNPNVSAGRFAKGLLRALAIIRGASSRNSMNDGALFVGDWAGTGSTPGNGIETPEHIASAAKSLVGAAITLEHRSVLETISTLDNNDAELNAATVHQALSESAHPPVGRVLAAEGTRALIQIRPEYQQISQLIRTGVLDLSLTHLDDNNAITSLELSLVLKPARKGATLIEEYKAQPITSFQNRVLTMSSAEQPAQEPMAVEPEQQQQSPLVDAFDALPEEHRTAIQERVTNLQSQLAAAEEAKNSALAEVESQKKLVQTYQDDAKQSQELLQRRIDLLASDLSERYPDAASMIQGCKPLSESHPAAAMTMERMVRACNELLGAQPLRMRKRAKPEPEAVAAAPKAAVATTPARSSDSFRNFLTSQFDCV